MKKMFLTAATMIFGAAILTAQTSEVKNTTFGLMEDNAIDQLAFGTEDGKDLFFAEIDNLANYINLGYGKHFGDALYLSFYDSWYTRGSSSDQKNISRTYGTDDGINIDYTDTSKNLSVGNETLNINNEFAVGLGLSKFTGQIIWDANWTNRQSAGTIDAGDTIFAGTTTTVSSETKDTPSNTTTTEKYDNIKNIDYTNTIGVKFNGIGVKDIGGNLAFYARLNSVRFGWNANSRANTYNQSQKVNGRDINISSAEAELSTYTFTPGINFGVGLNIMRGDIISTTFDLEDDLSFGFKASIKEKTHTTVQDALDSKTKRVIDFKINDGDYFSFKNTLTPKFTFDFNFNERLSFIAQVKAGIYMGNESQKANTYRKAVTTTTLNKTTGDKTVNKVTTTNYSGSNQDSNKFTFSITPTYTLGLVWQAIPNKMNLNLGLNIERAPYQWITTKVTNANINQKIVTKNTDALGNTTGSTAVTINNGGQEHENVTYTAPTSTDAKLRLGATWFFTENIKLDAYWGNSLTNLFGSSNVFGIDLSIKF